MDEHPPKTLPPAYIAADDSPTLPPRRASGVSGAEAPLPHLTLPGYALIKEIGRGGQAVVFLATQSSTGRRVAVKVMRDGPLADERSIARFRREVQVLASLNHPNIVTIFDTGRASDGSEFLAMDYIVGDALDEYVRRRVATDSADPGKQLRLFLRICGAVNAAHLRGVIHRDLKPGNIRVDERGEPHILDFGLARTALEDLAHPGNKLASVTGEFLGSLPWSSPEQAEGDPDKIDTRTDVYALGVILYQMLTGGRFPYAVVGTMRDVLNNILTADPIPPSKVFPGNASPHFIKSLPVAANTAAINPAIESIVLKALAKSRDDRYQTAGELGRDIANYLSGKKTAAPKVALPTAAASQSAPSRSRLTSSRWVAIGAIVSAVVVLAIAVHRSWLPEPRLQSPPTVASTVVDNGPAIAQPTVKATFPMSAQQAINVQSAAAAAIHQQTSFTLNLTSQVQMKFALIPAGEFLMGSAFDEIGHANSETLHKVSITRPFYLAITHVTVGQFKSFADSTLTKTQPERDGSSFVWDFTAQKWVEAAGMSWRNPGFAQSPDDPVVDIAWGDAVNFCQWISLSQGRRARLPTSAEWEYACRAGTATRYNTGDARQNLDRAAWFRVNANRTTHPVGLKMPNDWGLYDMHGNAAQWCSDWFAPSGPDDQIDPIGPATGDQRVQRGGSWYESMMGCRSAAIAQNHPVGKDYLEGFRVLLEMPDTSVARQP